VLSLTTPSAIPDRRARPWPARLITTASATDEDGDTLTFSLNNTDGYYQINPTTGVVTLTQAGADVVNAGGDLPAVSVTVSDGSLSDTESVTVPSTSDVNDAPVLSLTTPSALTEGEAVAGQTITTASATDEDGDTLTFRLEQHRRLLPRSIATSGAWSP
jgi:hypothetical protein